MSKTSTRSLSPVARVAGLCAVTAAALLSFGAANTAQAWHYSDQFSGEPYYNSGGNHYTGSPRSMYSCDACHTGSDRFPPSQRIKLQVTTERVSGGQLSNYDLFGQGYVPGDRYRITVTMQGQHRGQYNSDGSYGFAEGTDWKVDCPANGGGQFLMNLHNENHMVAEVATTDGVYAHYNGNAAGRLRPDSASGPTAEGQCFNGKRCTGAQHRPPPRDQGGASSVMYQRYALVDATKNPPFGEWACGPQHCDAIVTNEFADTPPNENTPFKPNFMRFFWKAPDSAPLADGGLIKFYLAGVDGDGYTDALDDDFAAVELGTCPVGAAGCSPSATPGGAVLGVTAAPAATAASALSSAAEASTPRPVVRPFGVPWVLLALGGLGVWMWAAVRSAARSGRAWVSTPATPELS